MIEEEFYETLYDEERKPIKRLKEQLTPADISSTFTTYDSSHGHCGLCGKISCNGSCFK